MRDSIRTGIVLIVIACAVGTACADESQRVTVHDMGMKTSAARWECTPGHEIHRQQIKLDSGARGYTIQLQGCFDPSHGDQHPCNEGLFGMPTPTRANWYAAGFMKVLVNGVDAILYQDVAPRVMETGDRGVVQFQWEHPDAEVGLRLMMLPGGQCLMGHLQWRPREGRTVDTVALALTCYPSYFTTFNNRTGDRHCMTPRTDESEGHPLQIAPEEDAWLYYYDTVFDVAKGEGDGPCAALVPPQGLLGGSVSIGGYSVNTSLDLNPAAGEARIGFYDFTSMTNAEAERYMKQQASEDLATLTETSFRPAPVRELDLAAFPEETNRLLDQAGEDGATLRPQVEELLASVAELKPAADAGDWSAEAELSSLLQTSSDMFWKLKAFAVLNAGQAPGG